MVGDGGQGVEPGNDPKHDSAARNLEGAGAQNLPQVEPARQVIWSYSHMQCPMNTTRHLKQHHREAERTRHESTCNYKEKNLEETRMHHTAPQ